MIKKYKKEEVVRGVIDFIKDTATGETLSEVANTLSDVVKAGREGKIAYIYTAIKLSAQQKEEIKKKLEAEVNHEIALREVVDKNLLAGFKIKLGDWVYDATVASQLNDFKSEMYANI